MYVQAARLKITANLLTGFINSPVTIKLGRIHMRFISLGLLLGLMGCAFSACSTIIEGRTQQIQVNTNPEGASCQFIRNGEVIASIDQTPSGVNIEKTKYDITIKCHKPGYQEATYFNHSGVDAVTAGNIVLGGFIGWGVDSAVGADNKYETNINLTLPRK